MRIHYKAGTFNLAVAGFAAASVAFALFAMPAPVLGGLLGSAGLYDIASAGQPAPGAGVRLGVVLAGLAVTFLFVCLLLRALDGSPETWQPHQEVDEEWDWVAPRLRKADSHPDAPPRRPILAAREFGEPDQTRDIPAGEPITLGLEPDTSSPLPSFLVRRDALQPTAAEESLDSNGGEHATETDLSTHDMLDLEPYPTAALPVEDALSAGNAAEEEINAANSGPQHLEDAGEHVPPAGIPATTIAHDEPGASRESLMARIALPEARGESVSNLLRRLDVGLANCEWPVQDNARPRPEGMDKRLRAAINDLQKMVARKR